MAPCFDTLWYCEKSVGIGIHTLSFNGIINYFYRSFTKRQTSGTTSDIEWQRVVQRVSPFGCLQVLHQFYFVSFP